MALTNTKKFLETLVTLSLGQPLSAALPPVMERETSMRTPKRTQALGPPWARLREL